MWGYIFKLSLKSEYVPESNNEDYLIEDILQRAYIDEKLSINIQNYKKTTWL